MIDGLAVGPREGLELDDVDAPIAGLTARNEGLCGPQPPRRLTLVEPGIKPGLPELHEKAPVGG